MKAGDKYTCSMCGGTFNAGRDDDEAWAEHEERHPGVPP
jgi:hypothetical protein